MFGVVKQMMDLWINELDAQITCGRWKDRAMGGMSRLVDGKSGWEKWMGRWTNGQVGGKSKG